MPVVTASGALLEQILDDTYDTWHEGLSRIAYGKRNAAQMRTQWGAERLHRVALVDEAGRLLASAKRYRVDAWLRGKPVRVCGIGAVFTQPSLRGRGHATALIEEIVREEAASGADVAVLFSEIGTAFYERAGFTPVILDEVTVRVDVKEGGSPAMLVRSGTEADLPAIAAMHEKRIADVPFALRRDASFIQFGLVRKRLLAGLGEPGKRHVEFFVAEEGASAVAYVILSINEFGWTLDEAGDRDPAAARLGAMFQVFVAREPSLEKPLIRAWWPAAFPVPPQLSLARRQDAREVMMLRALSGVALPSGPDVFYWRGDVF
jgi:predicted N-acetyltransferase YhbS